MINYTNFFHCPFCGSKEIISTGSKSINCINCGSTYFHNSAAAAGVILEYKNKILLIRRAENPKKGFFDLPGGFVDYGENLEEAIKREIKEELNLNIDHLCYYASFPNRYIFKGVKYFSCDTYFISKINSIENLKTNEEVLDIKFCQPQKINLNQIAFKSCKLVLEKFLLQPPDNNT